MRSKDITTGAATPVTLTLDYVSSSNFTPLALLLLLPFLLSRTNDETITMSKIQNLVQAVSSKSDSNKMKMKKEVPRDLCLRKSATYDPSIFCEGAERENDWGVNPACM
ncbi:hypothetical protein PROFUN_00307 [Planoprotostelium fungivorum]|uniref:Uncharacterized protein n=1 Tax=Planoprotostelium fungivorum TaxID=1890364 RepID=A0A2P6NY20_9EUKA|nr:hypothetical protein PROFUN_00307 [Planoprotostelium fungivorum]